jgi:transcriptional regulator with XRE-family HTH domain
MDIVSRLKQFMSYLQIPSSQFADTCNIPRPTLSQILTGRNRKISDEFIAKLHEGYPQLSIVWLLFGEGTMTTSGDTRNINTPGELNFESGAESFDFEDNMSLYNDNPEADSLSSTSTGIFTNGQDFPTTNANSRPAVPTGKKIQRIMVFYTDNSFEVFSPSSDS